MKKHFFSKKTKNFVILSQKRHSWQKWNVCCLYSVLKEKQGFAEKFTIK